MIGMTLAAKYLIETVFLLKLSASIESRASINKSNEYVSGKLSIKRYLWVGQGKIHLFLLHFWLSL